MWLFSTDVQSAEQRVFRLVGGDWSTAKSGVRDAVANVVGWTLLSIFVEAFLRTESNASVVLGLQHEQRYTWPRQHNIHIEKKVPFHMNNITGITTETKWHGNVR